ncbi:sensor histidine kinase [Paenibacillus kandeliae]|uniref:sensor histidine kinase n=1 Tax=Paenibacillus kandeliae TaxID=3231269 RepID=UPI00345917F1
MKNIYSQLVITFILVIVASFVITILMSDWVIQRQQSRYIQDGILSNAEAVAAMQAEIPEKLMQKYLDSQAGQTQIMVISEDGKTYRSNGNGPGGPLGLAPPPNPFGSDSSTNTNSSSTTNDDSNESSSTSSKDSDSSTSDTNSNSDTTSDPESSSTGNEDSSTTAPTMNNHTSAPSTPPPPPGSIEGKGPPPPDLEQAWTIPDDVKQLVLNGGIYHPENKEMQSGSGIPGLNFHFGFGNQDPEPRYVGVPFERDGVHYALFIRPNQFSNQLNKWMVLALSVMLTTGVLLFLFAARLIARPIAKLSEATRQVAKGDYNVRVNLKRKDEIGELGNNFNQMTSQLSKIEAMRQEFVSNVSHEIQTPLTSIRGFAVALKDTASSEQMKHLKIIEQESERLSKLSSNLLKLASLDVVKLNLSNFRLDEQVRMAVVSCVPMWTAKNIEVSADLDKIVFHGDEDLLSQVWINLLSNAIKFTPEKGNIYITLTEDEHWIKTSVQDTGCGIDDEHVKHIFERFYKADTSRNSAVSGNGLGLSIVQKILMLHGGRIEAISTVGEGTTMTVYLPRPIVIEEPDKHRPTE